MLTVFTAIKWHLGLEIKVGASLYGSPWKPTRKLEISPCRQWRTMEMLLRKLWRRGKMSFRKSAYLYNIAHMHFFDKNIEKCDSCQLTMGKDKNRYNKAMPSAFEKSVNRWESWGWRVRGQGLPLRGQTMLFKLLSTQSDFDTMWRSKDTKLD